MIEIHRELQRLSGLMHDIRCMPYTKLVLYNVEEEEKLFLLCHHSKKLAIACGLINTAPCIPLQIRKNLQVCEDATHPQSSFQNSQEGNHGEGCQLPFITLSMVFVHVWTIYHQSVLSITVIKFILSIACVAQCCKTVIERNTVVVGITCLHQQTPTYNSSNNNMNPHQHSNNNTHAHL
jgi:hypothetical protein